MLNLKAFMSPQVVSPEIKAAILDARTTDRAGGFVPASEFGGCDRIRIDPFPGTAETFDHSSGKAN